MYCNKENVNILTAQLVKHGVKHVVVCPGSRNAPLVHNFAECPYITCHPVTDERSAGFIALGMAQHAESPVAVCVTSGSALLNVLPAAAEATYQQRGIIVVSADRPLAWIGQLDGQTLPQQGALGSFVAKSVTLPEPHDDTERWHCSRLVNEALMAVKGAAHPSVHINVPITEPLFDFVVPELPDVQMTECISWDDEHSRCRMEQIIRNARRPMFIIGQSERRGAAGCDWQQHVTILQEQLSWDGACHTDQMLSRLEGGDDRDKYDPDLIVFFGGHTVSKRLRHFMRRLGSGTLQIIVSADGELHDISQHTRYLITGDMRKVGQDIITCIHDNKDFRLRWEALEARVKQRQETFQPDYSQMLAVKYLEQRMKGTEIVYYGNSMAVRLGIIFANHYCYCNRGLNGIEGSLSAAAGASLVTDNNVYCVLGDLSFLYDENALWAQQLRGNMRIMVLNNNQGVIFRSLKGLEKSPVRDSFIAGGHSVKSMEGVCAQFGIRYLRADSQETLLDGIKILTGEDSEQPVLLEVVTDPGEDARVFAAFYQHIKKDNY